MNAPVLSKRGRKRAYAAMIRSGVILLPGQCGTAARTEHQTDRIPELLAKSAEHDARAIEAVEGMGK